MKSRRSIQLWIVSLLLIFTAIGSGALKPKPRAQNEQPSIILSEAIPRSFGDWTEAAIIGGQIVNPQTQELLDKIYSQTLSRTYVNSKGYRIMLSLAYGDDQRGGLQAHMPEVCYPAQGFQLLSVRKDVIKTSISEIPVKRLETRMLQRTEPVTYWFAFGSTAVGSHWQKRLVEVRLGLTGQVPDGLLFRVSSIDEVSDRAYSAHDKFVQDLLSAMPEERALKISGLTKTVQ